MTSLELSQPTPTPVNTNNGHFFVSGMKNSRTLSDQLYGYCDLTEYLTSENPKETVNNLTKVLSNIQSTWLSRKLKATGQREFADFFK